jgi:nicotinamide mononucleotide transporter
VGFDSFSAFTTWFAAGLQALQAGAFTLWGTPVTWLEVVASLLGLAMVGFNLRVHPAGWPLAIASAALYALVFWHGRLYGQAALQLLFIGVSAWGWRQWLRGMDATGGELRVGWMRPRQRLAAAAATLAAWPLLGGLLAAGTDSAAPALDALTTVGSVAGQLLLARKRVENWPVWLAVNVLSVTLFVHAGLWPTALLYAVFAALAAWGWLHWSRLAAEGA